MSSGNEIDTEAFKRFERDGYSRVAEGYAKKTARVSSQSNDSILDAVAAGPGTRLLDVACGPGFLTASAVKRGVIVVALDFAPNMVAIARSVNPDVEIHEGDAENLPFDDGRFDAVVCSLGILHFPNPEHAIAEAFRVLRSGGRYAFSCWTPPAVNPLMDLILRSIETHGTLELDLPAGPPAFRFGDPTECEKVLSESGFVDTTTTEVSVFWPSDTPETFVQELPSSTARIGPMLTMQSDEQRKKIEQAMIEAAGEYPTEDGVNIPSGLIVAEGRKP